MKVVNRLIGFPLVVVVMISAAAAVTAQQPAATENTSRPRVASTPPPYFPSTGNQYKILSYQRVTSTLE